ncbi:MAG: nucleotidyl transferase AbiEii/AbiGii toxin family protein [Synergistaceae bacterium]|nr:nucleotidyl transferase AbiEii/AbiGii toxin family protein [Synergistaceae bacterium]
MNDAVKKMLSFYTLGTLSESVNALREIVQEIALLGLSRSSFFSKAAFYGGTALRIFYGLDRFSEDMDFSLLSPDDSFELSDYGEFMKKELESFGFDVNFEHRGKKRKSAVESAFLKADSRSNLLVIDTSSAFAETLPKGQLLKIKVEVDTDPPPLFDTEIKFHLRPIPFSARAYVLPDMFAGKMHALLCRDWKGHVKGRDWYDFVWYLSGNIPLHLKHLEARMRQSAHWEKNADLTPALFRKFLDDRIDKLDVASARNDVERFIVSSERVDIWSKDFFHAVSEKIILL